MPLDLGLNTKLSRGNLHATSNLLNIAQSFSKAASTYQEHAHMQNAMGRILLAQLNEHASPLRFPEIVNFPQINRVLEIGCGPGNFTQELLQAVKVRHLWLNDLSGTMLQQAVSNLAAQYKVLEGHLPFRTEQKDKSAPLSYGLEVEQKDKLALSSCMQRAEQKDKQDIHPSFVQSPENNNAWSLYNKKQQFCIHSADDMDVVNQNSCYAAHRVDVTLLEGDILQLLQHSQFAQAARFAKMDLVISNAVLQWLPLKQVLNLCASISKTVVFSSFSAGTFSEFSSLGVTGLNYLNLDQIEHILRQSVSDFVLVSQNHRQYFGTIGHLMHHLKSTGVNALGQSPLSAGQLRQLMRQYEQLYHDKRGVYLTWCPYYVVARF